MSYNYQSDRLRWVNGHLVFTRDYFTFGYMPLQIRLSSVWNVCAPCSVRKNFRQCFYAISHPRYLLISVQNCTEIISGEPLRWGLNAWREAKYSDVGHVEGYISETVLDTATGTIND